MADGRHALEHMEQDVGVMNLAGERLFIGLIDNGDAQPVVLERRNRGAETGRGAIVQDSFHYGLRSFSSLQLAEIGRD